MEIVQASMQWNGHGPWFPFPFFGPLLLVLLIGSLVYLVTRSRRGPTTTAAPMSPTPPQSLTAGEILRQRYARGEIDAQTFQQMREQLGPDDPRYS